MARRRRRPYTFGEQLAAAGRHVPGRSCPTRVATAGPDGTSPTASAPTGWSTTSRHSPTRWASATFHLVGYSMGGMTALGVRGRASRPVSGPWSSRASPRHASRVRRVVRRLMDPARIERDEPDWAADLGRLDETQRPGSWRELVVAVARRRRQPAAPDAASTCTASRHRPSSCAATATRSSRSTRPPISPARSATGGCSSRQVPVTTSPTSDPTCARPPCWTSIVRPSRRAGQGRRHRARTGGSVMTTLLALFRRPDGGPTPRRPSSDGIGMSICRSSRARRACARPVSSASSSALGTETDMIIATTMRFDDRAALDAGLAIGCDASGRSEPARDRAGSGRRSACSRTLPEIGRPPLPRAWILSERSRGASVTDTARSDPPEAGGRGPAARLVRVAFPAPAPASAAPATSLDGVALVTLDRPGALNALSFDLLDRARGRARDARSRPDLPGDRHHRLRDAGIRGRRRYPRARDADARLAQRGRPLPCLGPARGHRSAAHRRRARLSPWVAAASWRWPAT